MQFVAIKTHTVKIGRFVIYLPRPLPAATPSPAAPAAATPTSAAAPGRAVAPGPAAVAAAAPGLRLRRRSGVSLKI